MRRLDRSALDPLRAALIARAHRDADVITTQASEKAGEVISSAKTAAEQRLSEARARARAEAALASAGETAKARQRARGLVLAAHREVQDELRRRTREAVQQLRRKDTYERLRLAVLRQAEADLGPSAMSHEVNDGGWLIEAPGRRIDATLEALADWALESVEAGPPP